MLDYTWSEGWADLPEPKVPLDHWSHPGIAALSDARVALVHPGEPAIVIVAADGRRIDAWQGDFNEAHGITAARKGGAETLWIADPGFSIQVEAGKQRVVGDGGRALEYTLDGRLLRQIGPPPIPLHRIHGVAAKPTSVAVFEERFGGNGDIWITDGYGTFLIHRYDRDGNYLQSISGEEGTAGAFRNPHAILVDTRHGEPELVITDRHNSRVQVYDLEGRFKRAFGHDFLLTPTALAVYGNLLFVAELRARVAVLDEVDRLVGYLGEDAAAVERTGWPNQRTADERIERPGMSAGRFNSPHGIALTDDGTMYVAEFVIGGRYLKLQPIAEARA